MNSKKNTSMNRKEFLKLTTLSGVGVLIKPLMNFANPFVPISSNENVVFYNNKDAEYNSLKAGFNSRINRFPTVVAVCKNTQGVKEAVLYAKEFKLPISIKSGGHCMEGFSCENGSMQIVLSNINQLKWIDKNTISVGPAILLHSIYEELIPRNKILPGGSCATVAVGGLTLGGGYGLMSRLFGLTCDSLLALKMVDGNGNIISSKTDADLLWACKGGGNGNFGVVTEMVFKVHNRPSQMSSYRFRSFNVDTEKGKLILKTWFEESKLLPNACFSTCLFNGDMAYILLTNVSKNTPIVNRFIAKLKLVTEKFSANVNQPLAKALKNYYGQQHPLMFKNASAGLYNSYQDLEPMIDEILNTVLKTKGMIFQFNTLGGAIQNPVFEKSSSFPHRSFSFFTELQTYWETPTQGEHLMQKFEVVQNIIAKNNVTAQYRNYPDINFINYEEKYYGKNLAKLKQIKNKYDAQNIIRHQQSIKPIV